MSFRVGWNKSQLLGKPVARDIHWARSTVTCEAWFGQPLEVMFFMVSGAFRPDLEEFSSKSVAPRNVQMTRRAYKLLAVLIKSDSEAEVS